MLNTTLRTLSSMIVSGKEQVFPSSGGESEYADHE